MRMARVPGDKDTIVLEEPRRGSLPNLIRCPPIQIFWCDIELVGRDNGLCSFENHFRCD